jgi:hypothetical protein
MNRSKIRFFAMILCFDGGAIAGPSRPWRSERQCGWWSELPADVIMNAREYVAGQNVVVQLLGVRHRFDVEFGAQQVPV